MARGDAAVNPPCRLDDYRWLTGDEARRWLDWLAAEPGSLVARASRLRKRLSAERVHLLLEQVELHRRARAKFAHAERMFFTPTRLEQATDQYVAGYKASRFPREVPLADLCCGIGGDLLMLARRGPIVGVDCDPVMVLFAEANLRASGQGGAGPWRTEVRVEDATAASVSAVAAWHIDPDRRAGGARTTTLAQCRPGQFTIERLLGECARGVVKLAPATEVPPAWSERAELEWIGRDRQCRQLVAWFGGLAEHPGRRRATIVANDAPQAVRTLVGSEATRAPRTDAVGPYLFDPDPAVLGARLLGALAAEHGLAQFAPEAAYLTGECPASDAAVACFEVTDVLPFDLKRLRGLLKARHVGRLEIKKRAVPNRPEDVRRRLHLRGDASATLLLAPIAGRVTAIVARRWKESKRAE